MCILKFVTLKTTLHTFLDPEIMDKLLKESPFSLVKFQVSRREEIKFNDRRLNRVRNKSRIPFGPWARSVAESTYRNEIYMQTNPTLYGLHLFIAHIEKHFNSKCCGTFNFTDAQVQNFIMFLIITNSIILGVQAGTYIRIYTHDISSTSRSWTR
jgi:hypothetical protein